MSTLSVPLSPEIMQGIEKLVAEGIAENKAELARKAIKYYLEEHAIQSVLKASKEPNLAGDLDELAAKL